MLLAKGFYQVESIDFDETYAPVARLGSIRILLAYASVMPRPKNYTQVLSNTGYQAEMDNQEIKDREQLAHNITQRHKAYIIQLLIENIYGKYNQRSRTQQYIKRKQE